MQLNVGFRFLSSYTQKNSHFLHHLSLLTWQTKTHKLMNASQSILACMNQFACTFEFLKNISHEIHQIFEKMFQKVLDNSDMIWYNKHTNSGEYPVESRTSWGGGDCTSGIQLVARSMTCNVKPCGEPPPFLLSPFLFPFSFCATSITSTRSS